MGDRRFRFTNTAIDALPLPEAGRVEYRDTDSALVLRVTASGSKTFTLARKVNGRFLRVTVGTFKRPGDAAPRMTVDRARVVARKLDGQVAEGVDVNAEKRATRQAGRTLQGTLEAYLAASPNLKPRTRADYAAVLNEFCPDWLPRPLTGITREALQKRHADHGKRRSKARADNAVRVLRALFNFAGITPNPASSPKKRTADGAKSFMFNVGRKRTYIRKADMPAWWGAVSNLKGLRSDSGAADAADLLRLLLLTGLRAGEACALEWAHVNVRDGIITIPDTKNRDPHELPLGTLLHGIIRDRARARRGRYVFPAKGDPDAPFNYNTLRGWFDRVAEESGVAVTAHDCRRTFATVAEGLDISVIAVKRLLNHRTGRGDVTEGYIGLDVERLRHAMQKIEDEILRQAAAEVAP